MFFSALVTISLLIASVVASPAPAIESLETRELDPIHAIAGRAATTKIYMRIEGPTKTIYEKTLVASPKAKLTNGGHTAECESSSCVA